jgi:hypothetical protein
MHVFWKPGVGVVSESPTETLVLSLSRALVPLVQLEPGCSFRDNFLIS